MNKTLETNTEYDIPNNRIIITKVSSRCVIEVLPILGRCMIYGEFIEITDYDGNQNKFHYQCYYNFPEQNFRSTALLHVALRPIKGEEGMLECQFFYRGSKSHITYKIFGKEFKLP